MKINKFFVAAMAAMTLFASCSKENEGVQAGDGAPMAMNIRMSFGEDAQTYAVDTPVSDKTATAFTTGILYQMKGNLVLTASVLTPENVTALKSATGYRIENVNSAVDGVMIVGNHPASVQTAMLALANKATIESYAFTVASQQSTTTGGAGAGIANVTMVGFGAATSKVDPDAASHTGHTYKEAAVTIAPIVARIEVSGLPGISADASNQIKTIVWEEVYFNRFYNDGSKVIMTSLAEDFSSLPTWAKDTYSTQTEGVTPVKCYAYQFFPHALADATKLPMIVMKGTVTLKDNSTLANYYIAIKTFKSGATSLPQMLPNKIYKVSLTSLQLKHGDFTPKPNPGQVDLGVKVTVTPWTVETITPEV